MINCETVLKEGKLAAVDLDFFHGKNSLILKPYNTSRIKARTFSQILLYKKFYWRRLLQ